jgi:membrane-bound serine protease (ClpP class)
MNSKNVFRMFFLWIALFCIVLSAIPAASLTKRVYRISIEGMIDRGLAPYVRRVLLEAKDADAVILEINTLGGLVDAATQIRDDLLNTETATIAFINKRAISAGALISFATKHIVMSPGATIGAATPIQLDMTGQANPVSEKYVSYFRTEMRATAEQTGRRGDIAEAMVDADIAIEGVTEKGKLLTLTTKDALKYGIAEYEVSDLSQVLEKYNLVGAEVIQAEINWAERVVRLLTNPIVSSLLMVVGFIGLFIEFKTPGFGLGGAVGIICLGLFFWGHFIVRLAGWEEVILFVAGVVLLLIEIFVIPGFGVVGILGIIAIIASLVLALVGRFELLTFQDVRIALSKVTAALIASIILSVVLAKFLPRTLIGKQVILKDAEERKEGYVAQSTARTDLLGTTGLTITPLHPSGTAVIKDKRYDVVSEGDFIDKNVTVRVIDIEGARIVVRKIDEQG